MRMNAEEARKLGSQLINLATKSQAFEGISSAISAVRQPMASLTSESEGFTKAMRAANTMAGRDESGSGIDRVEADTAGRLTVSGEVYSASSVLLRSLNDLQGVTAAGCCEGLPTGIYLVRLTDATSRTTTVRTAVR